MKKTITKMAAITLILVTIMCNIVYGADLKTELQTVENSSELKNLENDQRQSYKFNNRHQ
jgi:hypothetical protein